MKSKNKITNEKLNLQNIYYVWNYVEWGGAQIYFLSIMRRLSRIYDVKAILPENSAEKIINYLKADKFSYEFFNGSINIGKSESLSQRIGRRTNDNLCSLSLWKILAKKNLKNSILHIDIAPWSNFLFYLLLLRKTKIFLTLHTPIPKLAKWRENLWCLKFRVLTKSGNFHLVASNCEVKNSLQKFLSPEVFDSIEIAYSSINASEIQSVLESKSDKETIAAKYNLPAGKFWLCNVGQFIERKGCWLLLEALKHLSAERTDFFFFWLGTAPLSQEVIERIKNYQLDEYFRFFSADEIGGQRADLLNFLASTDLFVMPSLEEGLPVALLEAMALEKCCVASDTDAIPEAIEHCKTGYLIEKNNIESIKSAINSLLDDGELRQELGLNASKKVTEKFNDEILGELMTKLYENAFHSKQASQISDL